MNLRAFEGVSQKSSSIGAQQKIAQGVQDHGLGDGAGLIFGMGLVQGVNPQTAEPMRAQSSMSFDQQIETVKKLKDLLDAGVLSEKEFELKKGEVMGL